MSQSQEDVSPPHPLLIRHLMLWTMCSAVLLAVERALGTTSGMSRQWGLLLGGVSILQTTVSGAAIAATLILITRWIRNPQPALEQPGHWLLVITSAIVVFAACGMVVIAISNQFLPTMDLSVLRIVGVQTVAAVLNSVAMLYSRELRWRGYFGFRAFMSSFGAASFLVLWWSMRTGAMDWGNLMAIAGSSGQISVLWLLVAAVMDWSSGAKRDGLHYLGIAIVLGQAVIELIWLAGSLFLAVVPIQ